MNVTVRGLCGKIMRDLYVMENDFPNLMRSNDEFERLMEVILESVLNFEGCVIENDEDLPIKFSDKYIKASGVLPKEDLILFSNDI